jgi:hypothetical protein
VYFHQGLLRRPELHDCLHGTPGKETKPHERFLGLFSPFQGRQDLRFVQGAVGNHPSVVYRYKLTVVYIWADLNSHLLVDSWIGGVLLRHENLPMLANMVQG